MLDYSIEVKNLNVSYKSLKAYSIKQSFFQFKRNETKIIQAVRDLSFDVKKGEVLGIVGKNGSGKSTLLRTLAGVFAPDSGTIDLHGNSISLLSLGTGFQSDLAGRENIFLNGMLLGFSEKQINEKLDEIIEFSELGSFIDMPVRTYSSGMKSKLSFSIAAILETDIILVDEVLSVGDSRFRKKSYSKMRQLIKGKERTALIVSHQEETLKKLCSRVLWLDEGSLKMIGESKHVLDAYLRYMNG